MYLGAGFAWERRRLACSGSGQDGRAPRGLGNGHDVWLWLVASPRAKMRIAGTREVAVHRRLVFPSLREAKRRGHLRALKTRLLRCARNDGRTDICVPISCGLIERTSIRARATRLCCLVAEESQTGSQSVPLSKTMARSNAGTAFSQVSARTISEGAPDRRARHRRARAHDRTWPPDLRSVVWPLLRPY